MNEVGKHVALLGKKALVLGGKRGLGSVRDAMKKSFSESGIEYFEEHFGGECCDQEIDRLTAIAKQSGADVIVGVGGGKALVPPGRCRVHEGPRGLNTHHSSNGRSLQRAGRHLYT